MKYQDEPVSPNRNSPSGRPIDETIAGPLNKTHPRTRQSQSPVEYFMRNKCDISSNKPVLLVKPIGYRSPPSVISVTGLKRKASALTSRKTFSEDSQDFSNRPSQNKTIEPSNQINNTHISRRLEISNLKPVVCLKHLNIFSSVSKMRKASLSPTKVPVASPRHSPGSRSRSQSPRKKADNDSPKKRSPRKKKSESPNKLSAPLSLDIPENQSWNRSVQRSPKRSNVEHSPQQKELSPRELDAIKTLRKLKARSPQKKAITNEMRKSACHSKQNERRDSVGAPSLQKPESKSKMTIPRISVTDPKGAEVKESPKRGRRRVKKSISEQDLTKTFSEQETAVVIKTEAKTSPKKRGRKKKSSTSSPDKLDLFPDYESLYDISAGLKVEASSRSNKRVRSPSARYKQDMIMYPWNSPKKKQSPKKSPTDKSPTAGASKEHEHSSSEESSSDESADTNFENDSPVTTIESVEVPSRESVLSAARVLNFDEVNTNEYSKIGEKFIDVDKYRSLLHSQEKVSTDLIGLSDLIAKVSDSVDKPNEELLNLFGSIEEPDYYDDNVTYKSDNDEENINESRESNKTVVEGDSDSIQCTKPTNEDNSKESMQDISDTGNENVNDSNEEGICKLKTDSDLDSTIEYGKDISPNAEKEGKSKNDLGFPCELKKNIVLSELNDQSTLNVDSYVVKDSDTTSTVIIPDHMKSARNIKVDQNSDEQKARNVFDLFNDKDQVKDQVKDNSNSEVTLSVLECKNSSFSDNEVLEHVSEDSIPDILDTIDYMSSESSAPLPVNETISKQISDNSDDSKNQEADELSVNSDTGLGSKTQTTDKNVHDLQKTDDKEIEQESNEKVVNDEDNDVIVVSETKKPEANEVIVLSDNENEDKNNNSSTTKTDRRGFEQLRSSPRCVPRFSTVKKNYSEPSPLTVLKSVEKEVTDKHCAFISHELEDYMKPYAPVVETKENSASKSEKESNSRTENERDSESTKTMEYEITSDLDASDKCVADVVAKLHSPRPDLDEIGDCMFLSFASEEALLAHIELEKKLDWLDETNLKRMTHMMNKDKVTEHDTPTPSKSPHTKHNLRGVPGRITKYRKMLKQEYDIILKAKENRVPPPLRTKTPEKTADITKIKGWKNKFANTAELQQATGLHFSEAGKLHWRTEERIMKQLEPEDVKEIGLDLKKKRRKLVHYTKRKGETKSDKPKHSETLGEGEEPLLLAPLENLDMLEEENSRDTQEKLPYSVRYHSQHKYGKRKMFVKQMKMNVEDENILKKLGSQKIADRQKKKAITDPESKPKRSKCITYVIKLSHSMALAALSALDKKLMIKAKAIARQKAKKKELKEKLEKAKQVDEVDNDSVHEIRDKLESLSESDGEGSDGYEEIPEDEIKKEMPGNDGGKKEILEKGDNGSKTGKTENKDREKSGQSKSCDQPGCRYGCICHLYKFSEKDSEKEDSDHKPPCDKEYCRLGCICDSIDTKTEDQSHCRKPDCMFGCKCKPKTGSQETGEKHKEKRRSKDGGQQKGKKRSRKKKPQSRKSSLDDEDIAQLHKEIEEPKEGNSDWEPPAKKQRESNKSAASPRFADLPRRETKYRLAKNLDAVTRKAKQVYESSEMYVEQKVRRRRSDPVIEMVSEGDFLDHLPPDWRDSLEPSVYTAKPDCQSSTAVRQGGEEVKEKNDDSAQPCSSLPPSLPQLEMSLITRKPVFGDSDQPSTSTSTMEISGDEDEGETSSEVPPNCARTAGYTGHRKSAKPFLIENSSDSPTGKLNKKKETVLIDLVDSDCEVTEIRREKTDSKPREMTVSEKLGLMKRRASQDKDSKKASTESKWKTQMVCLKAKKKVQSDSQPSSSESEIKLLEIISNCNWEADRANMLSKISHIISKDYSKSHVVLWNNYALQFLPKADKPAVIPPELKAKLPNSMYSIRIRVTQNLHDIEQAENGSGKESDANASESLLAEGVNSLSDKDKEQYASLRVQKKLIDKIRFAEKLKELIEQEEKKGTYSSKFSISKDGIEKALKRYKTQLWRAYTGNSNMTLSQLREAVMKAKSSNYTEKINQAITAIEKKAQDTITGASETSQSNVTVIGATSSLSNAQDHTSTTTVTDTTATRPVTDTTKSVTNTTTVKSGSDLKTLSSSAKARIEANQGIVIKGSTHSMPVTKAPMTRLITQGGKQSDIYLVPVTGENATTPTTLSGKLNVMSADGATNVVNLQPVPGSAAAFKITGPDSEVFSTLAASKTLMTSTSAPVVVNAAVSKSTAPVTSPSVVTTLAAPVVSSLGTPRMFKPIPASAGATPVRMPVRMLVNGHPENIGVSSPVGNMCTSGPQPVILSGTFNGQKVLAIQKINVSQSGHPASTTVHSAVVTSITKSISQNSGNLVTLTATVAENGHSLQNVMPSQPGQAIIQVSSSGINRPQLPVTMVTNTVNGPQTGSVSNPFYPPVRFVGGNARPLPPNQFVSVINSQQIVGKPLVRAPQPLNVVSPRQMVAGGPRQMVPIRVINHSNNSNAIVQLIPVTSTPPVNSDGGILTSIPGSKPEFIAVPVHFEKNPVASQVNVTLSQTLVNGVETTSAGIKTLHRSTSPAAAFMNNPHGVIKAVPVASHRPVSPANSIVPFSSGKSTESDIKLISIPHVETCPVSKADTSKMQTDGLDKRTENATPEIEYIGAFKCQKDLTPLTENETDREIVKANANNIHVNNMDTSDDLDTVESHPGEQLEKTNVRKRKKSYAEKLEDLNRLGQPVRASLDSAILGDENNIKCRNELENADFVNLCDNAKGEHFNETKRNKLCENLSTDIINLSKATEDTSECVDELTKDQTKVGDTINSAKSERCIDVDSVDGDANFNNNFDCSPSVLSESSDAGTVNINAVIDNTKNAGLQIASVLGNTLDSPVIATSAEEIRATNVISVSEKAGVIEHETEAVLNELSDNVDNDSQDSDGCLIIDENYISPSKRMSNNQKMETGDGVSKKRKLEDVAEEKEGNKRCRSSSYRSKEESSHVSDILQICIEVSEDESDVEILGSSLTLSVSEAPTADKRKPTQSFVPRVDSTPIQTPQIASTSFLQSVPRSEADPQRQQLVALQKHRRKDMKKKFTALAKLVLMYNPEVKQKYIKFITDSTVQLPKMMILDGAKDLIENLHEEYQCLHELLTDGKQYSQSLRNKLKILKDSYVRSGTSEIVVDNFLKSVASSVKLMESNPDSNSGEATKIQTNESSATLVPTSQSNDTASQLNKTGKISCVDLTDEFSETVVIADVVNSARKMKTSLLKNSSSVTQKFCVSESGAESRVGSYSVIPVQDPAGKYAAASTGNVTDSLHENKSRDAFSVISDEIPGQTTVGNCKNTSIHGSSAGSTNDSTLPLGKTIAIKSCDNQEKCDSQSSAPKIQTDQSGVTVIQTSQSNETSSQTSSQSSEKIVLMDSSILENSAAKINHSELTILEDSENEEQGKVHHLDDILDEWSAEICSQ